MATHVIYAVLMGGVSADVSSLNFWAGGKLKPRDVDVIVPLGACIIILKRMIPFTAFVCVIRCCVQI